MTRWFVDTLVIFQAGLALEGLATVRAVQLLGTETVML